MASARTRGSLGTSSATADRESDELSWVEVVEERHEEELADLGEGEVRHMGQCHGCMGRL